MSDPSPTPAPPSADEPTDRSRSRWWQAFRRAPRAVRWTAWTAVGPSPCTQIESTWQGMRLPEVE